MVNVITIHYYLTMKTLE